MGLIGKKVDYVEVEATVVSIAERKASGSRAGNTKVYQPTFCYEWKGFTRTVEYPVWASFYDFELGDKVQLLVNPEDPSDFKFKKATLNPAIFFLRMLLFMIVLAVLFKLTGNK